MSFVRKAADIASFYGFKPVRDVEMAVPRASRVKRMGEVRTFEEVASTCVTCMVEAKQGPVLCFSINHAPETRFAGLSPREAAEFSLQLIGSTDTLGDIFILRTVTTILREVGAPLRGIRLNSMGDRESQGRFMREIVAYLKRRAAELDEHCREALAGDVLAVYECTSEGCRQILREAPRALTFLSEKSRGHFREVLEHLERLDVPYAIDDLLISDSRAPRLLFTFDLEEENATILSARGGRYDEYLRKVTGKKEGVGVRASIFFRKKGMEVRTRPDREKRRSAKLYFVQLGAEAKLKSMVVLETLRKAKIPVYQSFESNRLSPQLQEADSLKVPYLLIMGHKEALEDSVVVREVSNRSQTIVPIPDLPRFLARTL